MTNELDNRLILRMGSLAAPQIGGDRNEYLCRFVRAGRVRYSDGSLSDIEVMPRALEAAVVSRMFHGRAVFVDHAGWMDYPSLDNLVGVVQDAVWNVSDESVNGTIRLYSTPGAQIAAQLLDEILADPDTAPDVGLSMVFYPVFAADEGVRKVVGINHVESVDLVFQPAADGRVLQKLSSFYTGAAPGGRRLDGRQAPYRAGADVVWIWHTLKTEFSCNRCMERDGKTFTNAELSKIGAPPLHEGCNCWLEATTLNSQAKGNPMTTNMQHEEVQGQPASNPVAPAGLSNVTVVQTIFNSGLPQAAQERLAGHDYADLPALNAAIEGERQYLAALAAPGVVHLSAAPRGGRISGMIDALDRVTLAAEALFQGVRPAGGLQPLSGIRELYNLLSGDYDLTGVFQPERVQFANVTSSTMAGIVANALNKAVVNAYQEYPKWWLPIVREVDFTNLQAVKWISLGGVGELPTVAEGAAYTELTWDDNTETASFVKKGGYLGITLEAIDKDDTSRITAAPRALAQAAWLTLSKLVSAIFTTASGTGPTLADGQVLFYARTAGTNVGSTALSITEWNAVRTAMRKFTELNSGERLGGLLTPKFLLVPPELEQTAIRVMATEFDYTYALSNGQAAPVNDIAQGNEFMDRIANARRRVIVVDLWTDANNWAAVCDPNLWPTIGIGYRWGRQPEVFSVASPTAGLMFTNDTLPVKVRFITAVGAMDWRGMYKENVA
jgi:hypothetical protein